MLWKTISKKLKMILKLFSTFYLQINNQTEIAKELLKNDHIDPNISCNGRSVLEIAFNNNNFEISKLILLNKKLKIDFQNV